MRGLLQDEGGSLTIVEGRAKDPKVQAYVRALGGADHVVALHGTASVQALIGLKKPGGGSFYLGPADSAKEKEFYAAAKAAGHTVVQ